MTGKEIAAKVGVSAATVSRVLKRLGLSKLSALEPAEPPRRYQREQPGELIHIDIKKLGKFNQDRPSHHRRPHRPEQQPRRRLGVRPCLHRRCLAHGLQPDHEDRAQGAVPSPSSRPLSPTTQSLGITVERVMTDNGSCYRSRRLPQGLPPPRPQAHPHQTLHPQDQRQGRALHPDRLARMGLCPGLPTPHDNAPPSCPSWMHRYNWHRPHGSIGRVPPISTLGLTGNNLLRLHI